MKSEKINALITGGASGLGEATVRRIIDLGGTVTISDFQEERCLSLSDELGKNCVYSMTDVTNEESINKALLKSISNFGPINLVVNCAGIGVTNKVLSKEELHSTKIFEKVINVNLNGSFNVSKLAFSKMKDNLLDKNECRGVIINTASIAAFDGQIGQAAYSASKGGVVALTLPLAREFARYNIRICTIAPGLFETPMMAGLPEKAYQSLVESTVFPKRLGKPEEYAQLVISIFENNMLNGEVIRLDGSLRMAPK
jgi:3-hydroxyacyl-CoA dehydrogenase / 3-hydroxy-2-methylbutyryl-CoA dehydrogenase